MPHLSDAELKTMLVVYADTVGWDLDAPDKTCAAAIPYRRFERLAGLSRSPVYRAIKSLIAAGVITAEQQRDPAGDLAASLFRPSILPAYQPKDRWVVPLEKPGSAAGDTTQCRDRHQGSAATETTGSVANGTGVVPRAAPYTEIETETTSESNPQKCSSPKGGDEFRLFPPKPRVQTKGRDGLSPQQEIWFGQWWPEYWRHEAKKAARMAFGRQVKTEEVFRKVMVATRAQSAEMMSREPSKRPHGATWLNGERWNDEIEVPQNGRHEIGREQQPSFLVRSTAQGNSFQRGLAEAARLSEMKVRPHDGKMAATGEK
jgi:hypothetical protein